MNDLPDPSGSDSIQGANPSGSPSANDTSVSPVVKFSPGVGLGAKESEPAPGLSFPEHTGLVETHKDIELPPEVVRSGVSVQPTQITVPPVLQAAGIKPAGTNVTLGSGQSVTLPLTDDQIAQGLKTSVTESWHWLAEWCVRKLKQMKFINKPNGHVQI